MSKPALPKQPMKTASKLVADGKAGRSAAALRDNLKRRKAQQRARDATSRDEPAGGE